LRKQALPIGGKVKHLRKFWRATMKAKRTMKIPLSWIINPPSPYNVDTTSLNILTEMLKSSEYAPIPVVQISSEGYALLGDFIKYAIAHKIGLTEINVSVKKELIDIVSVYNDAVCNLTEALRDLHDLDF